MDRASSNVDFNNRFHSEPAARAQTHRRADRRHSPSVIIAPDAPEEPLRLDIGITRGVSILILLWQTVGTLLSQSLFFLILGIVLLGLAAGAHQLVNWSRRQVEPSSGSST